MAVVTFRRFARAVRGRYVFCRVAGLTRRTSLYRAVDTLITEYLCGAMVGHDAHWVNGVRQCSLCELPLAPARSARGDA